MASPLVVRRIAARLRRKAKVCMRAAAIPTQGGHAADRVLPTLADELEHEADELEGDRRGRRTHGAADIAGAQPEGPSFNRGAGWFDEPPPTRHLT